MCNLTWSPTRGYKVMIPIGGKYILYIYMKNISNPPFQPQKLSFGRRLVHAVSADTSSICLPKGYPADRGNATRARAHSHTHTRTH